MTRTTPDLSLPPQFLYPRTTGQAELMWVAGYAPRRPGVNIPKLTGLGIYCK